MKRFRKGFTLIEVALFLVVTGALFVGVTIGVQNSIFQQRNNDAVQNFAEFLRSVYSNTSNVESEGSGRSEKAIYGKLVTFGESVNLAGEDNEEGATSIYAYNIIGDIKDTESSNALEALKELNANVVVAEKDGEKIGYRPVGMAESYAPRWAAEIQNTNNYDNLVGALLVVRHPKTGTFYTYTMNGTTVQVNEAIKNAGDEDENLNPLIGFLGGEGGFKSDVMDFCVNATGEKVSNIRYDVRVLKNARNTSGVEIIPFDSEVNKCSKAE